MYVRTLSGPDQGGLVEVRRDQPPSDYFLVHGTKSVGGMVWVDETHVLLNVSGSEIVLLSIESGAILASTAEPAGGDILISADRRSFWCVGKEVAQYSLPDLKPIGKKAFGIRHVSGDKWQLVTAREDVPPVNGRGYRFYEDFRDFEHQTVTRVAINGNRIIATAPPGGKDYQDRKHQGTELMKIDFDSGEVQIQALPGTSNMITRPFLSLSPDGQLALRPSLEPIVTSISKVSLLSRLMGKQKNPFGERSNRPDILFHDDTTFDPNEEQIGFPLEVWDVKNTPSLIGLVIPQWHGLDLNPFGIEAEKYLSSSRRNAPELFDKLESVIQDIASREANSLTDYFDQAVFYGCSGEALFHLAKILNRMQVSIFDVDSHGSTKHHNIEMIRKMEQDFYNKIKKIHQPPLWLEGHSGWEALNICKLGELVQFDLNGKFKRIKLPLRNDIPLSPIAKQNADFIGGSISDCHASKNYEFYREPQTAILSFCPRGRVLVGTGVHPTILRPEYTYQTISAEIGSHTSTGAWTCVYTNREDNSDQQRITKRLVDGARFGVVSISGRTEKQYVAALKKLLGYFEKSPEKLVHSARYTPTFKRKSQFIDETAFCSELVKNDYKGAVPLLDKLIVASHNFHGPKHLSVWHHSGGIHTCAPMVFARFQLAGAFGQEALCWLHGHDAGHETYCFEEMNRLAEMRDRDGEDYAKAASILFWHEVLHGHRDDPRTAPFFLGARAGIQEEKFRRILRANLRVHLLRHGSDRDILFEGGVPNRTSGNILEGIENHVEWALSR